MVLLFIFSSMLLYITVVKKKLWNNWCSYSLYFLPHCFNYPNQNLYFSFFFFSFFSSSRSLLPHLLIFLFFHFPPHKATHNLIFLYILLFFDNSWRTFNASSSISSCMKLLEYHASSWHGHASHLMVCWLMSSH